MKIIKHKQAPRVWDMDFATQPMTVWLHRNVQLIIEVGDQLKKIADVIAEELPMVENPRTLATFYFEMGERASSGRFEVPWNVPLNEDPMRRYLGRSKKPKSPKPPRHQSRRRAARPSSRRRPTDQ